MGISTTVQTPRRELALSAWCIVAAFGTYFCMYAFRKPFTAGSYGENKTVLVIAQVLGYTLSKFIGIKVIAELPARLRVRYLVGLIAAAWAALLLFAVTVPPFNALWLFANGVALGMVFGLVLGFLEGRRQTEALAAGLCASFIVADGATRSVGAYLLEAGVSESWMPFLAGLLFVPALALFVWMLTRIPQPSPQDIAARGERVPMSRDERWRFFRRYAMGLTLLVVVYLLITILRSVRADFAREIWAGLGTVGAPAVFAQSEIVVAASVLLLYGATVLIRDNRTAFFTALALSLGGAVLLTVALLGLQEARLPAFPFMVLHGLGLYLPYIAVHTTLFERLIAMTRERGNIGYLMYLADAFGYLGYVLVMLAHGLVAPGDRFLDFFVALSWVIAGTCFVLLVPCWRYFAAHPGTRPVPEPVTA